jgi:tRNA (guanine37-N1)-methyltransferase
MHAAVITLFPDYFRGPFDCGPTRVARTDGKLELSFVNPRDFTTDAHRTVDDYPFGGGAGMVMKPEPLFAAIESVRRPASRVVLLSPQGERFSQPMAEEFSRAEHLVLVCGRYKGVDERIRALADREVSVGDYVLAGGEAAAVVIIEAVARLLPGAVGDEDSVATDSFSVGILDAPYYTRPREFRGREVPEVLVSGDHASVGRWRREQALITTAQRRPELLRNEVLTESEREFLCRELEKEIVNG